MPRTKIYQKDGQQLEVTLESDLYRTNYNWPSYEKYTKEWYLFELYIYIFDVFIYWPEMHKSVVLTNQMQPQDLTEKKKKKSPH